MHFYFFRKWLGSFIRAKDIICGNESICDSETWELNFPGVLYIFDAGKQWYMVGVKNEKSQCNSVNSYKLKMDLLGSCLGTRWSCHCWWDGSSRKWKGCFQGNPEELWIIFIALFYREISNENRTTKQKFPNSLPKSLQLVLSPPTHKILRELLMNILTLMMVSSDSLQ